MTEASQSPSAIVVGAGLSGLITAKDLLAAGWTVSVLEASDLPGGRLVPVPARSAEGFLRERGFPLPAFPWPAMARHLDLPSLGIKPFAPELLIWTGTQRLPLSMRFGHTRPSTLISLADTLRLSRWALEVRRADWRSVAEAACTPGVDRTALDALHARGFSESFIDRVARPVFGGLMLDRTLTTSEGVMNAMLRTLVTSEIGLPTNGLAAIPDALVAHLPPGTIITGVHVDALLWKGPRVVGVRTTTGEHRADAVVVATDPPGARALTGIDVIPTAGIRVTTALLAATDGPEVRALGTHLLFNGTGRHAGIQTLSHLVPISAVQPTAAPSGQSLLAAIVLDPPAEIRDAFAESVREDAAQISGIPDLRVIDVETMPFAAYEQPPGIHRMLPDAITGMPGLFLASDITVDASPNGAILSGESAARAAINATG